jgi:hypothetical protein
MTMSLLEYADVIWDNNITYLVDKIEKVQMEADRIVTGNTQCHKTMKYRISMQIGMK